MMHGLANIKLKKKGLYSICIWTRRYYLGIYFI